MKKDKSRYLEWKLCSKYPKQYSQTELLSDNSDKNYAIVIKNRSCCQYKSLWIISPLIVSYSIPSTSACIITHEMLNTFRRSIKKVSSYSFIQNISPVFKSRKNWTYNKIIFIKILKIIYRMWTPAIKPPATPRSSSCVSSSPS